MNQVACNLCGSLLSVVTDSHQRGAQCKKARAKFEENDYVPYHMHLQDRGTKHQDLLTALGFALRYPIAANEKAPVKSSISIKGVSAKIFYAPAWAVSWITHVEDLPRGEYRERLLVAGLRLALASSNIAGVLSTMLSLPPDKNVGHLKGATTRTLSRAPKNLGELTEVSPAIRYLIGECCTTCQGLGGLRIAYLMDPPSDCKACKNTGGKK